MLGALRYRRIAWSAMLALAVGAPAGCRSRARGAADAGSTVQIDEQQRFGAPACPAPRILIDEAGAHVSMVPSNGWLVQADGPPPRGGARSLWQREIVPAAGGCPSVGRHEGRLDLPALTSLLRQIVAVRPGCPEHVPASKLERAIAAASRVDNHVLIAVSPDTPAGEVREVAEAAAAVGLTEVRLRSYFNPPPDCGDAIRPADLRRLEPLAP
jgi:hypothetical protein